MSGERMQKRNEFEKAFLLWKATKDEEHRAALAARKKAEEDEEIRLERKRVTGLMAYEKWKTLKLREHEDKLEERRHIRVQSRLENAAKEQKLGQAQAAFRNWKERKKREETDRRVREEVTADNPRQTVLTPTCSLPGYCSVWECDRSLAQKMLWVCPRQAHQSSIHSKDSTTNV